MTYAHDPSTPAYYAEVLAATLDDYEPSPAVIGDVAMRKTWTAENIVNTITVTLYPQFVLGRAPGTVSITNSYLREDGELSTNTRTAWFKFDQNCDVSSLRLAITHAMQVLVPYK